MIKPHAPIALAVGHVTLDQHGAAHVPGGSAFYAARAWAALGAISRLVSTVGTDFTDSGLFDGIDEDVLREGSTTVFANKYPSEDVRIQTVQSQAAEIRPRSLRPVDLLFLAPVLDEVALARWRPVKAKLRAVALQGFVRRTSPGHGPRRVYVEPESFDPAQLAGVDVAVLSDEDLAGADAWLARVRAVVPLVALTHGPGGATLWRDGEKLDVGTHPAQVVDPTGAGDSFAAGLLLGLVEGATIADAARLGTAVASVTVEHQGVPPIGALGQARKRATGVEVSIA